MSSTIYRRHSMAQLYEKLRAQDDDDDTAWLAQFSPEDKFDEPYVPVVRPPTLSSLSSASPISSCSSSLSASDPSFGNESSDDPFDFDSDSDTDLEPVPLELPYTVFDPIPDAPLVFDSRDSPAAIELSDPPHIPSEQEITLPGPTSTPLSEAEVESPLVSDFAAPSIASRRTPRFTRRFYARRPSSHVRHDPNEDAYSESDGNGSEDEYVPSPSLASKKRHRSTRPTSRSVTVKPSSGNTANKRPRHSPLPRNVQATADVAPVTPVAKNNPWACPYCKWVQRNHRTPDLKRHIRTHTRLQRPAQWVCCGVPVKDAENYNLPADAKSYVWAGETMIGGCRKEFSRRDALKRHLDNDHINCVGDFSVFASICEDET